MFHDKSTKLSFHEPVRILARNTASQRVLIIQPHCVKEKFRWKDLKNKNKK